MYLKKFNRLDFLRIAGSSVAASAAGAHLFCQKKTTNHPNIIFILADDGA